MHGMERTTAEYTPPLPAVPLAPPLRHVPYVSLDVDVHDAQVRLFTVSRSAAMQHGIIRNRGNADCFAAGRSKWNDASADRWNERACVSPLKPPCYRPIAPTLQTTSVMHHFMATGRLLHRHGCHCSHWRDRATQLLLDCDLARCLLQPPVQQLTVGQKRSRNGPSLRSALRRHSLGSAPQSTPPPISTRQQASALGPP